MRETLRTENAQNPKTKIIKINALDFINNKFWPEVSARWLAQAKVKRVRRGKKK